MRHCKTYMYINFQQNRVNRSVLIVHRNLFAKNRKLYKFANTNSNFEKSKILLDRHHHKTYIYISIFSKIGLIDPSNRAHKIFVKNCKLHKFATTNSNFEKNCYLRHASS